MKDTTTPDTLARPGLSTDQLAAICHVRPSSVREHLSRRGHYYGLRPDRLPNGRLTWPADSRERLLEAGRHRSEEGLGGARGAA